MSKYINIDNLNWYDDLFMKGINNSGVWVRYRDVENFIKNAPAADVEEVTHCEDCIHCVPLDSNCEISPHYKHCTAWHGEETKNVWHKYKKYYKDYSIVEYHGYCSFGEKGK